MYDQLKSVRSRVEEVLSAFPEARNDDKVLLKVYYALFHGIDIPDEFFALGVPGPETIRRTRQSLQERGMYPPTEEAIAIRRGREEAYRVFYGEEN